MVRLTVCGRASVAKRELWQGEGSCPGLGMGGDRNDGDQGSSFLALGFIGPVVPKNAIGAGGIVLSVRLEYLFAMGASQGGELVRIQAGMAWVEFQVTDGLPDLREDRLFRRRIFERRVLPICRGRELDLPVHAYSLAYLANEPR